MEQIHNIQEAVEIYNQGILNLFCNPSEWKSFLNFSSKFYKYKFHENLLLYSQNKNITICATFDEWKKANRYVKPYSKSLKTIYSKNGRLYLKSVFDISDTNSKNDIDFKLWETTEQEAVSILKSHLTNYFDESENTLEYLVQSYIGNILDEDFFNMLELPFEDVYNDDFYSILVESITAVVLNRCNVQYEPNLKSFENIKNIEVLKRIGFAVNKCSYDLLKIIELEIKERLKNKELEEILNERNSINKNDQNIGGNKTDKISRIDNEWNNKRSTRDLFSRNSQLRGKNRRRIKNKISKTRYNRVYSNRSISKYDTNVKNGNDKQYDTRENSSNVDDERVVQTTLFNFEENEAINNDEFIKLEEITSVNPFIENEKNIEIPPPPTLFKIPDNLKTDSIGLKKKYQENIEAIKLLKQLEYENREADNEEKIILAKYNGWGGLSKAFEENSDQYYELKQLLSKKEFEEAKESTITAFYTEPFIIDFMYKAIQRFGINNKCRILEPSAGVGNFIGRLPKEFDNSKITAIEKDDLSGRILKKIYSNIDVQVKGYEDTKLNNNYFDIAISNIPFGEFGVFDKDYNSNLKIHDYFFEKTLDKIKPGGIIAFVTSRYTLDKKEPSVREYLNNKANFLGAVRLPKTAFKSIANTEAISDIIFLQKKGPELEQKESWIDTFEVDNDVNMNTYFSERKYMIQGEIKIDTNQYGKTLNIEPTGDLKEQLDTTLKMLPSNIANIDELSETFNDSELNSIPVDDKTNFIKDYTFAEIGGNIYYRINDNLYQQNKGHLSSERIKGLIKIRNSLRKLIDIENTDVPDEFIKPYQTNLNQIYDTFVKKYGYINDRVNSLLFKNDADFPLLISLEKEDKETHTMIKTDIFFKRTIKPYKEITNTENAKDALIASINQKGKVDIKYIMKLCNKDYDTVIEELKRSYIS